MAETLSNCCFLPYVQFIALLFTTGQMWNYIRGAGIKRITTKETNVFLTEICIVSAFLFFYSNGTGLMARTQNGLSPIAHGFRNQTQLETAVVMALSMCLQIVSFT